MIMMMMMTMTVMIRLKMHCLDDDSCFLIDAPKAVLDIKNVYDAVVVGGGSVDARSQRNVDAKECNCYSLF